jgi:DNA-binding NarL/FixJ family response regulator
MQARTDSPAGAACAECIPGVSEEARPMHNHRSLRTFVVEDSPVIRQNLISTLEELAPVQVIGSAESEADAVEQLRLGREGAHCDLVILDIVLRQGTGLGVLGNLGRAEAGPKFVVLSNYATPDVSRRALALGAVRVFDKSNDIDALVEYCQQLARE